MWWNCIHAIWDCLSLLQGSVAVNDNEHCLGIKDLFWKFAWTVTQLSHLVFNLDLFSAVSQRPWVRSQPRDKHQTESEMGHTAGCPAEVSQSPVCLTIAQTSIFIRLPPAAVVLLRFTSCNTEWRYFHQWIKQAHVETSWLQETAKQLQNRVFDLPVPEVLDHLSWLLHLVHSVSFGRYYFRAYLFFLIFFL